MSRNSVTVCTHITVILLSFVLNSEGPEGPQLSAIHRFGLPRLRFSRELSGSVDSVVFVNTLAEEDEDSEYEDDEEDSLVKNIEVGRVAGWCASFDKVLADPLGVQCFHVSIIEYLDNARVNESCSTACMKSWRWLLTIQMFLKGEHSDENILFWKEVEEFKKIANSTEVSLLG